MERKWVGEVSSRPALLCPELPPMETVFLPWISGCSSKKESLRQHPAWPSHVTGKNWGRRGTVTSPGPHSQGQGQDWNPTKRKNQYDWACLYLQFWYCFPPWSSILALIWFLLLPEKGFPGEADGKASVCNARDLGLIPGSGRSPGEGSGNPPQSSCLQNFMGSLVGYSPRGHKWSDTTEWLTHYRK